MVVILASSCKSMGYVVGLAEGAQIQDSGSAVGAVGTVGRGDTWTDFPRPYPQPGLGLGFRIPSKVWTPSAQA